MFFFYNKATLLFVAGSQNNITKSDSWSLIQCEIKFDNLQFATSNKQGDVDKGDVWSLYVI